MFWDVLIVKKTTPYIRPYLQLLSIDSEAQQGVCVGDISLMSFLFMAEKGLTDKCLAPVGSSCCSVFELAGRDKNGLLATVLRLLVENGLEVISAAVGLAEGSFEKPLEKVSYVIICHIDPADWIG